MSFSHTKHARRVVRWTVLASLLGFAACDDPTTVVPIASIAIDSIAASLVEGDSLQLSVRVLDEDGQPVTSAVPVWSTSRDEVASVTASGKVTARAPGIASVFAVLDSHRDSVLVTVLPKLESLHLSAERDTLIVGDSLRIAATLRDIRGQPMVGPAPTWRSSDDRVATVSAEGVVTARARGAAEIIANVGERQAQVRFTIDIPLTIEVAPGRLLLTVGRAVRLGHPMGAADTISRNLVSVGVYDAGGVRQVDRQISVSVSAGPVVDLEPGGVLRALAPGRATLTLRSGRMSSELSVLVVRPYTVTVLEPLPGGTESRGHGVNRQGEVAGISFPGNKLVVWRGGSPTEVSIDKIQGDVLVGVAGINDRSEISGTLSGGGDPQRFFVRNTSGTFIGQPAGSPSVTAPNDRGELVVIAGNRCSGSASCPTRFYLVRDNILSEVSYAPVAINDRGQIAANPQGRGAALVEDGVVVRALGSGIATAIDPQGRILGYDGRTQSPTEALDLWIWDGATKAPLQKLANRLVIPYRANSRSQIIGNSAYLFTGEQIPVLWNEGHIAAVTDLTATEWVMERVGGINDSGQIAGYGRRDGTGLMRALLLTPQ